MSVPRSHFGFSTLIEDPMCWELVCGTSCLVWGPWLDVMQHETLIKKPWFLCALLAWPFPLWLFQTLIHLSVFLYHSSWSISHQVWFCSWKSFNKLIIWPTCLHTWGFIWTKAFFKLLSLSYAFNFSIQVHWS